MNLLPVMSGKASPFSRTVFWRFKRAGKVRKAVREDDLKYVNDGGAEELHNLAADLMERKNLLPEAAAEANRLKAKIAEWERDVMSPRLRPFRSQPG